LGAFNLVYALELNTRYLVPRETRRVGSGHFCEFITRGGLSPHIQLI